MSHLRLSAGLALVAVVIAAAPAAATPPGRNGMIVGQREGREAPRRLSIAAPDGSGARMVCRGSRRQAEFEGTCSPTDPNVMFFSRGAFPCRPFVEDIFRGDLSTGAV